MKKLFMFLAVAGLATFGASCSSDDNKSDDPKLALKADKTDIKVDETVTFTVESNGKAETAADLYKDGTKISNPYKFTEEGEFSIVAKKKGAVDSNAVKIKVTKDGTPGNEKTLKLTAEPNAVKVGEEVTFTVKDNNGEVVTDAKIKQGNVDVVNQKWSATAVGTFKFKATKEGYNASEEVSVVVTEAPAAFVLALVTNPEDVFGGEQMELSLKDASGAGVVDAELFLNGSGTGIKSEAGGKYIITPNIGGDYELQAKKGNDVSNIIVVVVQDPKTPETEIDGTFVYKGATSNVTEGAILYDAVYYINQEQTEVAAFWNLIAIGDNGKATFIEFSTPATGNETDGYAPTLPTTTNTSVYVTAVLDTASGQALDVAEEGTLSFGATPNENGSIFTGVVTAGATLGGQPFTLNLDGELIFGRAQNAGIAAAKKTVVSRTVKAKGVKKAANFAKSLRAIK